MTSSPLIDSEVMLKEEDLRRRRSYFEGDKIFWILNFRGFREVNQPVLSHAQYKIVFKCSGEGIFVRKCPGS